MAAVLLELAGGYTLDGNAKPKPPDGKLLKLNKAWADAKAAVIGANSWSAGVRD